MNTMMFCSFEFVCGCVWIEELKRILCTMLYFCVWAAEALTRHVVTLVQLQVLLCCEFTVQNATVLSGTKGGCGQFPPPLPDRSSVSYVSQLPLADSWLEITNGARFTVKHRSPEAVCYCRITKCNSIDMTGHLY